MFTMAVGQSDDVDPHDAIESAIAQCRAGLASRKPVAGMLFVGFDVFDPLIPAAVRGAFSGIQLIGTTSAAEMSSAFGYQEDAVVLVVFATDDDVTISAGAASNVADDIEGSCRAAVDQALTGTDKKPRLCVLLADALSGQDALGAVQRALPESVLVVGGAASGPHLGTPRPSFEFHNDDVLSEGVALMLFSGDLQFSVAVGTGLRQIGPRGVVTSSAPGVVVEIDGHAAATFIAPYVDVAGPASFGNPLAIQDAGSTDWYLRAMFGEDASGGVMIPGRVPLGAHVQLTTTTTDEIVGATSDVIRRANAAFPSGGMPAGALLFSCAVRKFLLGSRTSEEFEEARSLLPEGVPVAGMYCVGEIAPGADGEPSRFHNETFVALLFGS